MAKKTPEEEEQRPVLPGKRQEAIASPPEHAAIASPPQPLALSSALQSSALSSAPAPSAIPSPPEPLAIPAGTERPALGPAGAPAPKRPSAVSPPQLHRGTAPDDPHRPMLQELLKSARTIAVVGASDTPGRPSHRVYHYLLRAGFEVFAVNPAIKELGGRPAYPDLRSVPVRIDVVDIFRKPEAVLPIVEEAIAVGAGAVWMQEGVVNEEAAARARAAGLAVVMDHCIMKEHRIWRGLPAEEPEKEKAPR